MEEKEVLIIGYVGYSVTENGTVIGKKNKPLSLYQRPDGYSEVKLYTKGEDGRYKRESWLVHILVAMHFLPHNFNTFRPPKGVEVNHKNKIRTDNRIENLEFVTSKENKIHCHNYGKIKKWERSVIQMTLSREYIAEYSSLKEAESKTGVKLYNISKACRCITKVAGGYLWMYNDNKTRNIPKDWKKWSVVDKFNEYRVSKNGDVFSVKRMKLMSLNCDGGYFTVKLCKNGKGYKKRVHILVANAYIYKPISDSQLIVNHKNGNKQDNNMKNLEWVTPKENSQHACDAGLCPRPKGKSVIQYSNYGIEISRYNTIKEASQKSGANPTSIAMVCNGKRKKSGGYVWKWS